MSASPIARQATQGQAIPKRILISDPSQLPHDYSSTPGGTLYSTTPGGTRIIYDRASLLQMRNSPLAQTPPKNLPNLPQIIQTGPAKEHVKPSPLASATVNKEAEKANDIEKGENKDKIPEEPQFEMDI